MVNWQRQSALQEFPKSASNRFSQADDLCIRELPFIGKLIFQASGNHEAIQSAVSRAIGQELPLVPNTSASSTYTVLWMKPGKWMILSEPDEVPQIRQKLESALTDINFMISDVSDSRTGIEVNGAHARTLISRVCALDLDARSFTMGQCAQTLLVRIPLLLHQLDEQPTFHLYVDRSVARYAWDWLSDAANEFTSSNNAR
jgi:sarcosine oxidase subunit gamma